MKLTQIELRRFGRFTDVSYGLAPDAGLHVLYGSNEAGKTTLLDAVTYALHGMPQGASKERAYGFAHPLPTLRVGLKMQRTDGSSLHFLRKRGRTGTVLDPDTDAAAPEVEAQLNGLLAGIGKDEWRLRHGLSQEKLRAGANEMLASGGDAGDALFAAATGITVVRSVLNDVRARRRALLADSGRTGELHVAVQAYETARKQVEQARSASSGYEQQIVRRDQITEERTRITGEHASLQARIERIDAARKVAAELAARAVLTAELGECPEPAIAWTKAEHDDLIETTRALEAATEALRERDLLLTRRTAELAEHIVDERLVAAEDEMTSLLQRIELVRGVRDRQPKLELKLAAAMDALQAAVADLGGLDGIDVSDESQIDIEALRRAIPSLDS
ncbi:MAG: AAA family ATPase, partial [Gaiellales bacterium]